MSGSNSVSIFRKLLFSSEVKAKPESPVCKKYRIRLSTVETVEILLESRFRMSARYSFEISSRESIARNSDTNVVFKYVMCVGGDGRRNGSRTSNFCRKALRFSRENINAHLNLIRQFLTLVFVLLFIFILVAMGFCACLFSVA